MVGNLLNYGFKTATSKTGSVKLKKRNTTIFAICLFLLFAFISVNAKDVINGAGASFPYPVYSQWAYKYNQITGVKLNYQSIGSGGGIQQIKAKTVDFGASDAPMEAEELNKHGLIQFPMVTGGVAPVVNIKGIKAGDLKLSGEVLANIFLGTITKWNDAAIQALNPDLNLPKRAITVVRRADGSGTTWIFTKYLAGISDRWKEQVGAAKAVEWPTGIGGKGNEGVAAYVQRVNGGIGYVEFAYALQNKLAYTLLENAAGNYVPPTHETFMAATEGAGWEKSEGFYVVLVNQPGESSWPITGASFIIMHKSQEDAEQTKRILNFFDWCYDHGDDIASKLDYIPIPNSVVEIVQKAWKEKITHDGNRIWK